MLINLLGQNQTKNNLLYSWPQHAQPCVQHHPKLLKTIPAWHMVDNFSGLQAQLIYNFYLVSPQGWVSSYQQACSNTHVISSPVTRASVYPRGLLEDRDQFWNWLWIWCLLWCPDRDFEGFWGLIEGLLFQDHLKHLLNTAPRPSSGPTESEGVCAVWEAPIYHPIQVILRLLKTHSPELSRNQ